MRKLELLRLAGALGLAIAGCSVVVAPAQAAGLSDKQKDEIAEFFKCEGYLLRGDLVSFGADPDCGHGPPVVDLKSLGSEKGDGSTVKECVYETSFLTFEGGDSEYCDPPDR